MLKFIKNKKIIKLEDFLKNQTDKNVITEFKKIRNFIITFFTNNKYEKDINDFAKELVRKYYFESIRIQYIISKTKSDVVSEADDVSEQIGLSEDKKEIIIKDSNFLEEVKNFYLKTIDLLPDELLNSFKNLVKIYNWIDLKEKWVGNFDDYFQIDIKMMDKKYKEKILDFITDSYIDIINSKIFLAISNGITKVNEKKKVVTVLIGKTGVGKSTLANIFEGYYNGLKGVTYKKIKIGHHSRGSNDYEMISIPLGIIEIVIVDTIGTCDTNTSEYSFSKIWIKLTKFLIKKKLTVDIFLYMIDGSDPRMDQGEFDSLKNFIECMKVVNKDSLDYWKKIIIVVSKGNLINLDNINGIEKYKYKSYIKKNKLKDNIESINSYNQAYLKIIKKSLLDYKKSIEERVFTKISDNRNHDVNDQSFFSNFKLIVKNVFPDLSTEYILDIIGIIDTNKILIGTVEKNEEYGEDDFRDCRILSIPDFDSKINSGGLFDTEDPIYKRYRNDNIYSMNWFNDLQNRIMNVSSSIEFKLTIANLNEIKNYNDSKSLESSNTSNTVEFDKTTKEEINKNAGEVLNRNPTFLENIGTFFKNIWFGFLDLFK
jgi:predicted GTPase